MLLRLAPALAFVPIFVWAAGPDASPASAGESIAKQGLGAATACQSCHGARGEGNSAAGFPRLAGLPSKYIRRQLAAFAEDHRRNPVMMPIAKALSESDRAAVGAYYASLRPSHLRAASSPNGASSAARLASDGRWSEHLPACVQCHAPGARGVGDDFPPLAAQPAAYLANQLRAWKTGTRPPGPMGLMKVIAGKLTDDDIDGLAQYFAALPATDAGRQLAAPAGGASAASPAQSLVGKNPELRPDTAADANEGVFRPPPESAIPEGEFGDMIRRGREVFTDTPRAASRFVGNSMRCSSCHLDAGRLANSAPLWAAYVSYPAYRSKTKEVNTYEQRLQGCFRYSMNGTAPPLGDPALVALETYSYWLATGARIDPKIQGRGYPKLGKPALAPDYERGARVYEQHCALCHGANGAGQRTADRSTVFPALWGADSFNWGAGMGSIVNAAAFVHANMPLGLGGSLSEQDAWDVATFMDSHERPQDPRYAGSVAETRRRYHDTPSSMYGQRVNGQLLGDTGPPRRSTVPPRSSHPVP